MTNNGDTTPEQQRKIESQASAAPDELVPASALRRLIAFLIDLVLVLTLQLAIGGGRWGFVAIFAVYHTVLLAVFGRTLGKVATALKVRKADGSRLGVVPSLLRSTVGYLASSFILLGFLYIFRDPKRRGWHDVLFGSEVVQQPGALTLKRLIRAIDDWTEQLDAWLDRILARYNRLERLFSLLLKLTGLVTLLRGWIEQFVGWVVGYIKGTAAAAATQATAGAAATATGTTAAAAGTGALTTVTSIVTALVLTGATVITYQALVPRASPSSIYFNDFETKVGPQWSKTSTDTTPRGDRKFLGQFGNETVTLTLKDLPPHAKAKLSFDLFVIQSWDGNDTPFGPDIWDLRVRDGPTLLHTTFSKGERQAYPSSYPDGDYAPRTWAAEKNMLGYSFYGDAVYNLSFTFPHSANSLVIDFSASGLQTLSDESWGLDNVKVSLIPSTMDAPTDLSGRWIYGIGGSWSGKAVVKQNGDRVRMLLTWTPNSSPAPHYEVHATLSGRILKGKWWFQGGGGDEIQREGDFYAEASSNGNRIQVSNTEDTGTPQHKWNSVVIVREGSTQQPAVPQHLRRVTTAGKWAFERVGDCSGHDVALVDQNKPDERMCRPGILTAVCWDGKDFQNRQLKSGGCSYKTAAPHTCRGGTNPGRMYRCDLGIGGIASDSIINIEFEDFKVGADFHVGSVVPEGAYLSDQYLGTHGVRFGSQDAPVGVVHLGHGHASSGRMGIGGMTKGLVDYSAPITIAFFRPSEPQDKAVKDFVSIKPDQWPAEGVLRLEGFDVSGTPLGKAEAPDGRMVSLVADGIHSVRIIGNGSAGFDDLIFNK